MTIENIYTLMLETKLGPRYLLITQAHHFVTVHFKNDKKIPFYGIISGNVLNPYGLATMDELRYFYDWTRTEYIRETDAFQNYFKKRTSFYGYKEVDLSFYEICLMVTESLNNPMTPESIFGYSPLVDVSFNKDNCHERFKKILLDKAIDEFQERPKGTILEYLYFKDSFVTKKQREEMEKGYFVIELTEPEGYGALGYFTFLQDGSLHFTVDKNQAKQFRTENDVLAYIDRCDSYFGENGYEIIEVKGMRLEDGLDLEKIATL